MNHTSEYEFTIIVPVYNEQDNIDRLEKAFRQYLPAASRKSCVLFVDDGSTDDRSGRGFGGFAAVTAASITSPFCTMRD